MDKQDVFVKSIEKDLYRIIKDVVEIKREKDDLILIKEDGEQYVFNFANVFYYNPVSQK